MVYSMKKKMDCDFDSAVEKVKEAIKEINFGIVSEFRFDEKLKKKVDIDMGKYLVLGVYNPILAKRSLEEDYDMVTSSM